MTIKSVQSLLESEDPLSQDAFAYLLNHKEEDEYVDFKLTFEDTKRGWVEITKDILAFTNSDGGYLCFGIEDKTYNKIGLTETVVDVLTNVNNIRSKINSFIEPEINSIRSKQFQENLLTFVLLHIPPSKIVTHMIKKDVKYNQDFSKKIVLHKNTSYVRGSAGNLPLTSANIDRIFERRLRYYKDNLLGNLRKVVMAPIGKNIKLVSPRQNNRDITKAILDDSPEAIPIKGIGPGDIPSSEEEKIQCWINLSRTSPNNTPPKQDLWYWYSLKDQLKLCHKVKLEICKFAMWKGVPPFYWLKECVKNDVKKILNEIIDLPLETIPKEQGKIVGIARFISKTFHNKLVEKATKNGWKINKHYMSSPQNNADLKEWYCHSCLTNMKDHYTRDPQKGTLSFEDYGIKHIANLLEESQTGCPGAADASTIWNWDFVIYAPEKQYPK